MADLQTGTVLEYTVNAKPRSPRARRPCATVMVTYFVEGDGCPTRQQAEALGKAPLELVKARQRIEELEAALREVPRG